MKAYPNNGIAAITVQLVHEIDMGTDRWDVALCKFSCSAPNVNTLRPNLVVGDTRNNFMQIDNPAVCE